MDQLDAKNKVDSVLVNEGFDEHEGGHAPVDHHSIESSEDY